MQTSEYLYNLTTDKDNGLFAGILKFFLWVLSVFYGLVIRVLALFFRLNPCRLECKVISIGNITWGGTGKTALVEYLASYLKAQGRRVAILSRGYKRKRKAQSAKLKTDAELGDEPAMLIKNLGEVPVIVDANRARGGARAIKEYGADTVILDDGLQQWRIKKDLEIVAIDANNPFGNRQMLPRGILREPLSALARADIFILTKSNLISNPSDLESLTQALIEINPSALIFRSVHQPIGLYRLHQPQELLNPDILKNKTVTLFSGIADPQGFSKSVEKLGVDVALNFKFRDHHSYSRQDLEDIARASLAKGIETIVTTEKDAVRLSFFEPGRYGLEFLVLRIALKVITDEEVWHNRLLELYSL